MNWKALRIPAISVALLALFQACTVWENEMGQDLLPPGDAVFLHHDTIFDISAYPVSGRPLLTSDLSIWNESTYQTLLGESRDSITGYSKASMFTNYNLSTSFIPAANTIIDSAFLRLYMPAYIGDNTGEFTITVYESQARLYMDSAYYSNFDPAGKYDPRPLATYSYFPDETDTIQISLTEGEGSAAFIEKFLLAIEDTAIFDSDSAFKDHFNGFYIEASSASEEGCLVRILPNDLYSTFTMRYANDSTDLDSIPGPDYRWVGFTINEYISQKINVFEHDYSGTTLAGIIDRDDIDQAYCYAQGMGGVGTRFSFDQLAAWLEDGTKKSISSARLILEVVDEDLSGIAIEDLPYRMDIYSEDEEGRVQRTYDYIVLSTQGNLSRFGGTLQRNSTSMFADTTYRYDLNMNLHFQHMVDGADLVNNFRLQVNSPTTNPEFVKFWGNLSTNPARIRLEVVYLKL